MAHEMLLVASLIPACTEVTASIRQCSIHISSYQGSVLLKYTCKREPRQRTGQQLIHSTEQTFRNI
jgi:hypothetical protein